MKAPNLKKARKVSLANTLLANAVLNANFKVLMENENYKKIIHNISNGELNYFDFPIHGAKEKYRLKQEVAQKIIEKHDQSRPI